MLVTTHLMEEAERCDRLAIYADGNVVALGTPAELKSEIGGDVILLESEQPESLAQRIAQRFGLQPTVLDHRVRLEIENGHRFVTDVVEAFPGEIEGVSYTSRVWKMCSSAAPAIASGPKRTARTAKATGISALSERGSPARSRCRGPRRDTDLRSVLAADTESRDETRHRRNRARA